MLAKHFKIPFLQLFDTAVVVPLCMLQGCSCAGQLLPGSCLHSPMQMNVGQQILPDKAKNV